jgi:hypothetical protein
VEGGGELWVEEGELLLSAVLLGGILRRWVAAGVETGRGVQEMIEGGMVSC